MIESSQKVIPVDETTSRAAFLAVLEFIYTDRVTVTHNTAIEILVAATEYLLPRMITLCEEWIRDNLTLDTICDLWMVAEEYGASQLWKYCKHMVQLKLEELKGTAPYKSLPKNLKSEIVEK